MDIVSQIASRLKNHGIESSRVNAEIMLSDILDCRRLDLYINDIKLNQQQLKRLEEIVSRRINGEPLQYITGRVNFYGHEFLIEAGVFIPRPETEILVDTVLNLITSDERPSCATASEGRRATSDELLIFDLGTGSGNIAISLTKALARCKIIASDISEKAIALAEENAGLHGVADRIEFIRADLFNLPKKYKGCFNLIVSNPPYIADERLGGLPVEVKKEPHQALNGGRDGISFYSRIIEDSPPFLKKDGIIALELADGISEKAEELFKRRKQFCSIAVFKDLNGIIRVITAKKL